MEEWLSVVAHYLGLAVEAMALLIIAVGSVKAIIAGLRVMLFERSTHEDIRHVWIDYARWLVAGLTFQVAADIVHTSVAPTWNEIGRLAAIAVIRTFLSYFLERDLSEVRERQRESTDTGAKAGG